MAEPAKARARKAAPAKATPRKRQPAKKNTAPKAATVAAPAADRFGPSGLEFWGKVTATFELRVDEVRVLEDACDEIDLIERLRIALSGADLIVSGSMGQPTASPLVQELRQHRACLDRLLKSLNLPDDPGVDPADDRSESARERAMKRWSGGT